MRKLFLLLCIVGAAVVCEAQAANGFTKVSNVTVTVYTDTTCPNLSTCGYQVTSLDANGFESTPALCATGVLCFSTNIVVVTMPSSGAHSVNLSWTASTTPGVTYNVYRHIGPLPPSNLNAVVN